MATRDARIRRALTSQETLENAREHCSMDPARMRTLGLSKGSQVRIRRTPSDVALFTISETGDEDEDDIVRMAAVARQRLQGGEAFDATVDNRITRSSLTDAQARDASEFVERLDDNGRQQYLLVLAPHGGAIEAGTDLQAERVAALLGSARASAWRCKGFKTGGGASAAWHITSTEISEASFPLLKRLSGRGFLRAVAFHGFDKAGVLVGGRAPSSVKAAIVSAIGEVLRGSRIEVRLASPDDGLNGDDRENIVNRLTRRRAGGVQIEQSRAARDRFGEPIADAVADVFRAAFRTAA